MARMRVLRCFDPVIACPAGEPIYETVAGSGCRCRIERHSIVAARDPSSLQFCLDNYQGCPTWRARRDAWWEAREREFFRQVHDGVGDSPPERVPLSEIPGVKAS